jgi:hypothetical protein
MRQKYWSAVLANSYCLTTFPSGSISRTCHPEHGFACLWQARAKDLNHRVLRLLSLQEAGALALTRIGTRVKASSFRAQRGISLTRLREDLFLALATARGGFSPRATAPHERSLLLQLRRSLRQVLQQDLPEFVPFFQVHIHDFECHVLRSIIPHQRRSLHASQSHAHL